MVDVPRTPLTMSQPRELTVLNNLMLFSKLLLTSISSANFKCFQVCKFQVSRVLGINEFYGSLKFQLCIHVVEKRLSIFRKEMLQKLFLDARKKDIYKKVLMFLEM